MQKAAFERQEQEEQDQPANFIFLKAYAPGH